MRAKNPDFHKAIRNLEDLWWYSEVAERAKTTDRPLYLAFEAAYYTAILEGAGFILGYPGDDIRCRALYMQQAAAAQLDRIAREVAKNEQSKGKVARARRVARQGF